MNLFQFVKKYQLILILSFIAISLFIIKSVYGYKDSGVKPEISISPTPSASAEISPTNIPTIPVSSSSSKLKTSIIKEVSKSATNKLKLPYSSKNFIVQEFDSVNTFKVKLLNPDKAVVIQEIIKWLEKNGLNPVDYQVVFVN